MVSFARASVQLSEHTLKFGSYGQFWPTTFGLMIRLWYFLALLVRNRVGFPVIALVYLSSHWFTCHGIRLPVISWFFCHRIGLTAIGFAYLSSHWLTCHSISWPVITVVDLPWDGFTCHRIRLPVHRIRLPVIALVYPKAKFCFRLYGEMQWIQRGCIYPWNCFLCVGPHIVRVTLSIAMIFEGTQGNYIYKGT